MVTSETGMRPGFNPFSARVRSTQPFNPANAAVPVCHESVVYFSFDRMVSIGSEIE